MELLTFSGEITADIIMFVSFLEKLQIAFWQSVGNGNLCMDLNKSIAADFLVYL